MADEASHHQSCVVAGAPELFAAVDEVDPSAVVCESINAVRVLVEGNDLVAFNFLTSIPLTKAPKFLFAESFLLTERRCKSQLSWRSNLSRFIFYESIFVAIVTVDRSDESDLGSAAAKTRMKTATL